LKKAPLAFAPHAGVNQFIEPRPQNVSIGLVINHQNKDRNMTTITQLPFANQSAAIRAATPNRAARRSPVISVPALKLRLSPAAITRESLTLAAVTGLFWFQWEIVRCCW